MTGAEAAGAGVSAMVVVRWRGWRVVSAGKVLVVRVGVVGVYRL